MTPLSQARCGREAPWVLGACTPGHRLTAKPAQGSCRARRTEPWGQAAISQH